MSFLRIIPSTYVQITDINPVLPIYNMERALVLKSKDLGPRSSSATYYLYAFGPILEVALHYLEACLLLVSVELPALPSQHRILRPEMLLDLLRLCNWLLAVVDCLWALWIPGPVMFSLGQSAHGEPLQKVLLLSSKNAFHILLLFPPYCSQLTIPLPISGYKLEYSFVPSHQNLEGGKYKTILLKEYAYFILADSRKVN